MSADQQSLSHTPGPWFLEEPDGDFVEVSAPDHHALARVVWQMEDNRLCGDPSPTQNANARLIATSPELLEALKATTELLRGVNRSTDRPSDYVYRALAKADAAISKALGETQ